MTPTTQTSLTLAATWMDRLRAVLTHRGLSLAAWVRLKVQDDEQTIQTQEEVTP